MDMAGVRHDAGATVRISAPSNIGFVDNLLADTGDATTDGVCDDGSGVCTLREVIEEANETYGR